MEGNVIICDSGKLEKIKKSIAKDGAEDFFVLSDFDKTLTKSCVNEKRNPSLISVLRDGNYLTPDYAEKANALYDKYHPIEINPKIRKEEKKKLMYEWWATHFDLLIKSGLNKTDLKKVVDSEKAKLREGFSEFANFLDQNNIPFIIISSSGLGGDAIKMYLEKVGKRHNNIHIISNSYEWDEEGNAISVKQPIIHLMNKDGSMMKSLPIFNYIKKRKSILLLGDSLDDIDMAKGLDYDNLIKIAFLNENIEECMDKYKANYDIIALNDSPMFFVNNLLKEMIK